MFETSATVSFLYYFYSIYVYVYVVFIYINLTILVLDGVGIVHEQITLHPWHLDGLVKSMTYFHDAK